jgi:diguanylate cyclase (GGDEF)-like protein/PAS domain S-box-containing protein
MLADFFQNEAAPLRALRGLNIPVTPHEKEFDDLIWLAASVTAAPIALISLIDQSRQWLKVRTGLELAGLPSDGALSAYVAAANDLVVIPDASRDARFAADSIVAGEPRIRFFAGAPLIAPDGPRIGALCVLDPAPRELPAEQADALRLLARQVTSHLLLQRRVDGALQELNVQKQLERELRSSESRFRRTIDRLPAGILIYDLTTRRVVESNLAIQTMLGYSADELADRSPLDLLDDMPREALAEGLSTIRRQLSETGQIHLGRRLIRRHDGERLPADIQVALVRDPSCNHCAIVVRDVTDELERELRLFQYQAELEATNARLHSLADTDGLTGIRNRRAFDERFKEEFERSRRHGHPMSVLLIDVDHYKLFNDTFGHAAGDEVLTAAAQALQKTVRDTDLLARFGGEEFALILPETDFGGALILAERCRLAATKLAIPNWTLTVSIGVASLTPETAAPADLLKRADQALYRSKRDGRNRVS